MPVAVAICVITVAFVIAIRFIERARVAFAIPAGHVRLQDVVAERRGTGVGEAVLAELLRRIWRPVVVEVDTAATGLVEMYHRLGFRPASETTAPGGKLAMTRPASPTAELVDESLAGPFACWFWPSSGDITIGVAGAAAVGLAGASLDRFDQLVAVATAFVAASVASTDWRTRRIPNVLTAGGAVMLVALGVTTGDLGTAAGGALLMAGPLLASNLATGGRTPGLGDVKLAAVVGAGVAVVASLDAVLPTLTIALAVGAVFGAIYVRRSRRPGFPLGPPIAAATALTLAVAGLNHGGAL
ncbi:MAG: prepilin peptidase [Actinomycetota bacterium]